MQSQEYIQNLGYKYAVCVAKIKYQQRDEVKMGFSPVHFTLPESKTIVGYKTHRLLSIAHTYLFSVLSSAPAKRFFRSYLLSTCITYRVRRIPTKLHTISTFIIGRERQ